MDRPNHDNGNPADFQPGINRDTGSRLQRLNQNTYGNGLDQKSQTVQGQDPYRQNTGSQVNGYGPGLGQNMTSGNPFGQATGGQRPLQNGYTQRTGGQAPFQNGNRQSTGGQMPLQHFEQQQTVGQTSFQHDGYQATGRHGRRRPLAEWQTDPAMRNIQMMAQNEETMSGFGSEDVDPKIAQERSPNLYDKENSFWKQDTGSQPSVRKKKKLKAPDAKTVIKWSAITFLILLIVMVTLKFTVLSVQVIDVVGNETYSKDDIIRWSGIKKGTYLLSVDRKEVENALKVEPHLELDYVEKEIPGHVTIGVKERKPIAYFNDCGIFYTVDKRRVVLDMTENMESQFTGLFELKGLSLQDTRVGLKLQFSNDSQGVLWDNLIREIRVMQCQSVIREIDLNDQKSIRLVTMDPFTVLIGDSQDIHAKLRAMFLVREKLFSLGYFQGNIDVSDFEHPIYYPFV